VIRGYSVQIQWSDEDNAYIATCQEFPSLSGVSEDAESAVSELKEALAMAIEVMEEDGDQLPSPRVREEFSGQLRVRLPRSLHRLAATEADLEGVSLNTLLVQLISDGLSRSQTVRAVTQQLQTVLTRVELNAMRAQRRDSESATLFGGQGDLSRDLSSQNSTLQLQ
jgi:predicted HicB family RNase H-like nuclease